MGKYLDYNGLSYLWDKIKLYLSSALSTKVDKISSTDNAAARFNGEQGAILNSGVIIDDNNNVTATKFITSGGTSAQVVRGDGNLQSADTLELYEAYLKWGGKNFSDSYGPIDASMVPLLGACRTMFAKAAGIVIEYSTDGGATWVDYGATDAQKVALFSIGQSFQTGKNSTVGNGSANNMLRVTLRTYAANVYTVLNKFVIYVSTNGSSGSYCTIRCRTLQNYEDNVDTWVTKANQVSIGGWSGYNVINFANTRTYGNVKSNQYGEWQFIFGYTSCSSSYAGLSIILILGFGGYGWTTPSTMAKNGHLYSYDEAQNATFPANVTASKIIKSGGTSSQFLKADGSIDSNTYLKTGDIAAWAKEANKPSYSWSEITSKPDTFTPSSHTHGNISNTGTLTDTAATSGTNDLIVLRNSSDNKVRTSTIKGIDVEDAVSKKHSHGNITLSKTAQVYDGTHTIVLPSSDPYTSARTPSSHTHGNIQNGGTLQTNDVTIANGDKLVVTDSSDSSKVARTSVSFDGSTTTKALTPKGTWVTFLQTETDPTVPAWAKASSKPTYNLDEVSDGSTRKLSTLAPKASPALTGTPTAPTALTGTNTTLIATTAFVQLELGNVITDIEDNEKVIAASLNDLEERKLDAADLPEWAANSTKPSYSWSEITGKPSTFTPSSHTHGNITNAGELGTASRLVVTDSNKKITVLDATVNSPTASGTGTAFITSVSLNSQGKISASKANLPEASTSVKGIVLLGTTSTTAALGNHTHTTTIATSTGTNQLTLSHGGKYSITAGGTSYIFTMPASGNTDRYVNSAAFADDSTNTSASPVKMTLTRAGSDTATVTANIPKVSSSSAGVAPKGAAVSSQSQSTKFLREDGTWAAPSYTTNTNTTYSFTGGTNGRFSVTPSGGNAQTVTVTKSFGDSIEYIVGTQTAATNLWIGVTQEASLSAGKMIAYKLPVAGNGSAATLNLTLSGGGTTGAIGVRRKGTGTVTTHYSAGEIIFMVYDGSYWLINSYYDSDSTGYYTKRIYPNLKAGSGKIFPYTIIMQLPDGRWESLVTSSSTGTSKVANAHGFLLGHVLLMYANATYTENQNVGTYNIWSFHSGLIDHRYSFNTANDYTNGTTGYKPIYIVGSIGSDGLFYLDTTKWWTLTLPSTEDGKLYIYIGDAYDYYRMTFTEDKPIYLYSNGGIKLYGGTSDNVSWSNVTSKPSLDGIPDGSTRKLSDYVKYNPGASEQTIKSSISSLSKGVVNLWRNSGDYYTFLGFSNGTTETYLGGIGFKSQSDSNLYRKDNSGNYYKILDENNWTGVVDGRYLKLSGGTMTGALTLNGAPTSNLHAATKKYVDDSINALPEPMLFKGSLGTGGTITSLPTAAAANEGFTYKVITAGTYANQAAKIGDTFISDGSNWVLIPSGDEPSGTVTSVGASGSGGITVSGSPVTTSGTIAIGLNLSTAINGLGEGSSNATRNDYIVAQYAGGGTTTTTYHRRKLSNIFAALNSSDITTALGYTPYNSTNPNGYTSNTGTVTSITLKATSPIAIDSTAAITTSGTRTFSHSNSGVTAGTYESVTVNATGHVTAGTNPTKYWANVQVGSSTNYNTEPELKSVKINGSTTNSASSANALLLYDTTNKCLNFIVT